MTTPRLLILFLVLTSHILLATNRSYRIASYNVENFWDPLPYNTEENWQQYKLSLPEYKRKNLPGSPQYLDYSLSYSNWYEQNTLKAKVKRVLEVFALMNYPDIVALQEIESAGNQSSVFETPYSSRQTFKDKLHSLGYHYILLGQQEADNPVAVTTAFVSKIKLDTLAPIKIRLSEHSTSSRDIQAVSFTINDDRVVLFNNHWKSKYGNGNEPDRVQIAKQLKQRIMSEKTSHPSSHIMVLGDLNSTHYEHPLLALGATSNETMMLGNETPLLYNLWYEVNEKDRWESSYNGLRNTLSHILISDTLYNRYGFQYLDQSFEVVGHHSPEKEILLDTDGAPFRWQMIKNYNHVYHIGKGYSDHLPLVASFTYKELPPQATQEKKQILNPSTEQVPKPPQEVIFNEPLRCTKENSLNIYYTRAMSHHFLHKKCVRIELPPSEAPLPLFVTGRYHTNYIKVPVKGSQQTDFLYLSLTMNRSYDWRPNISDSRVSKEEATRPQSHYNEKNWHPHSNKCFSRKVLQGEGGSLRYALGRIDYSSGRLALYITSREEHNLQLEQLLSKKRDACPW